MVKHNIFILLGQYILMDMPGREEFNTVEEFHDYLREHGLSEDQIKTEYHP